VQESSAIRIVDIEQTIAVIVNFRARGKGETFLA